MQSDRSGGFLGHPGMLVLALTMVPAATFATPVLQRDARFVPADAGGVDGWTELKRGSDLLHGLAIAALDLPVHGQLRRSNAGTPVSEAAVQVIGYSQWVDDLPVFGTRISVLLDSAGFVRVLSRDTTTVPPHPDGFLLDTGSALSIALQAPSIGARPEPHRTTDDEAGWKHFRIEGTPDFPNPGTVRARAVWYPLTGHLEPAFEIELNGSKSGTQRPVARTLLVSARDGRILREVDRIHDLRTLDRSGLCIQDCGDQDFSYRVFADRAGNPYVDPFGSTVPHPVAHANGWRPLQVAPMSLVRPQQGAISTRDPWLPAGAVETVGNNVDAFFHGLPVVNGHWHQDAFVNWGPAFNAAHDHRARITSPGVFDHSYNPDDSDRDYFQFPAQPALPVPVASAQLNAKIVQVFYAANWLHDLFYDLGFDEAAGNMQSDNYGRGGIGGDPLVVNAAFLGTFAMTTADGSSPALVMGLNTFSLSRRDTSAFDFPVFAHEWTHTMMGRLTRLGYQGQAGALHEGTADFVGLFLMVDRRHRHAAPGTGDFHGAYPLGAYGNLDYDLPGDAWPPAGTPERPDNTYYHGIRRFPYSASLAINPLTFAHISDRKPLPQGFEPFDWKLRSFTPHEIHSAGEVWASALWQCARNILADTPEPDFASRHRRFLAQLVAALKLFPFDATFTEARDAVLMAVRADDEADYLRCRAGFARRGLGAGAVSPPRDSINLREVVESFEDADPPALR
jgi:hypothetical protein